jgi:hypothetical protein
MVWRLLPLLGLADGERPLVRGLFGLGAGWTIAFSQTFWYQAGLTEVYLLNAAFFAGVFLLLTLTLAEQDARWFLGACLLSAVGSGNHETVVLLIPALAVIGVWLAARRNKDTEPQKVRSPLPPRSWTRRLFRVAVPALLLGIAGGFIYAYLPVRAAKNPPLNWGDPSTAKNFLWMVRGGEFRNVFLLKAAPHVPLNSRAYPYFLQKRVTEWLTWTGNQFLDLPDEQAPSAAAIGFLILLLAGAGWWIIARRLPIFAIVLPTVAVLDLAIAAVYTIPDIEGYFFPTHIVLVICLFVALAGLHRWTEEHLLIHKSTTLAALFLALPAAQWLQGRAVCDHSRYDAAERYGREVLTQLAPDAMILTRGDYDVEPLWYQQIVERRRRDVVVFGSNFLATPGYAKYFEGRYDPPVKARYFPWTPYDVDYFKALADDIIAANIKERPMYSTWFDRRMGVEAQQIEVPLLRQAATLTAEERRYFPDPWFYRLREKGARP